MSREAIRWAAKQRTGSPTRKAVLTALAWRHHEDTGWCSPRIEQVAEETELNEKSVRRALTEMEAMGLISRERPRKADGTLGVYQYRFPPLDSVTTQPADRESGSPADRESAQVRREVQELETLATPSQRESKSRKPNPVWDALAYIFGEPTTQTATKVRGKVAASITLAGGTGEEVVARAKRWPAHFPSATMTDLALEKHWHTLARKPLRRTG